MGFLIFAVIIVMIAAIVFAVIALIRRMLKKTYKIHWGIARICLGSCALSLVIAMAEGRWNMMAFFAGMILIFCGICQSIVWIVRRIRKKDTKKNRIKTLVFLGTGFSAAIIGASGSLSSALDIFAVFFFIAAFVLLIVNVARAIARRNSLFVWLALPSCVALGIALIITSNISWSHQLEKRTAAGEIYEEPIRITYDFEVVDGDTPIKIVTSETLEMISGDSVCVYDESDLHLALETDYATADMCIEAIQANDKIESKFKIFFCDFVERIEDTYPGLNLAILYRNLETLDVQELSATDYMFESLSLTSLGCYNMRKNTIFIPEGTVYVEGEFGFQVLIHEFCHAVRSGSFESENDKYSFDFYDDSDNLVLMEAMNSVFSCSLLNYYEWDIAYQMPSNYMRIMLECMDNYKLEDYIKHRDTYFLSKLDETMGKTNYAQVIWKLIALQRSDWEDDKMDIPAEEYYPIFDVLCELYYGKYIDAGMSDEEKRAVADELVYKAFYDAPEGYKNDTDYFYAYLGL